MTENGLMDGWEITVHLTFISTMLRCPGVKLVLLLRASSTVMNRLDSGQNSVCMYVTVQYFSEYWQNLYLLCSKNIFCGPVNFHWEFSILSIIYKVNVIFKGIILFATVFTSDDADLLSQKVISKKSFI